MPAAITVKDVSKVYRLGERCEGSYRTLRESLARGASGMFRRPVWRRRLAEQVPMKPVESRNRWQPEKPGRQDT